MYLCHFYPRSRAHIPGLLLEAYHSGLPVRASTIYKALRTNTTVAQLYISIVHIMYL